MTHRLTLGVCKFSANGIIEPKLLRSRYKLPAEPSSAKKSHHVDHISVQDTNSTTKSFANSNGDILHLHQFTIWHPFHPLWPQVTGITVAFLKSASFVQRRVGIHMSGQI